MTEAVSDSVRTHELAITRVFDAPRELVWKAWTEPERLARWWGKRGWTAQPSTITMDVRPGGVFRLIAVNDEDGTEMPSEGIYREVVEPERLVFVEPPGAGCPDNEGAVGVVVLTDLGDGRTEMAFRTTVYTTSENLDRAAAGMASAFERLAEELR